MEVDAAAVATVGKSGAGGVASADDDGAAVSAAAVIAPCRAIEILSAISCGGDDDDAGVGAHFDSIPDGAIVFRRAVATAGPPGLHFEHDDIARGGRGDGRGDGGGAELDVAPVHGGIFGIEMDLGVRDRAVHAEVVVGGGEDADHRRAMVRAEVCIH